MKLWLLVSALLLADARFVFAQNDAPTDAIRRSVDTAVVWAMAADSLCGTAYLKNVIANAERDGITLDDIMRRNKTQIDERANRLITDNSDKEHKEKFCEKVKHDTEYVPEE